MKHTLGFRILSMSKFSKNITPYVRAELDAAMRARQENFIDVEFKHLENAHVLGQESTYWHTKVHVLMLFWGLRNRNTKEVMGQIFRIFGAATKTVIGLVPQGNTGGTNVSPFRVMPIANIHQRAIDRAKLD